MERTCINYRWLLVCRGGRLCPPLAGNHVRGWFSVTHTIFSHGAREPFLCTMHEWDICYTGSARVDRVVHPYMQVTRGRGYCHLGDNNPVPLSLMHHLLSFWVQRRIIFHIIQDINSHLEKILHFVQNDRRVMRIILQIRIIQQIWCHNSDFWYNLFIHILLETFNLR